jgi:hypothetical protein
VPPPLTDEQVAEALWQDYAKREELPSESLSPAALPVWVRLVVRARELLSGLPREPLPQDVTTLAQEIYTAASGDTGAAQAWSSESLRCWYVRAALYLLTRYGSPWQPSPAALERGAKWLHDCIAGFDLGTFYRADCWDHLDPAGKAEWMRRLRILLSAMREEPKEEAK